MKKVYFPMSADILHIGHLRAIRFCVEKGKVIIGLLTDKVIEDYKEKPVVPFEQRKELLEALPEVYKVIRQDSLRPNLVGMDYLASGDGFEEEEIDAAKQYRCELLHINLKSEKEGDKLFSSTEIKNKIKEL